MFHVKQLIIEKDILEQQPLFLSALRYPSLVNEHTSQGRRVSNLTVSDSCLEVLLSWGISLVWVQPSLPEPVPVRFQFPEE